jgi:hypothetical protein
MDFPNGKVVPHVADDVENRVHVVGISAIDSQLYVMWITTFSSGRVTCMSIVTSHVFSGGAWNNCKTGPLIKIELNITHIARFFY